MNASHLKVNDDQLERFQSFGKRVEEEGRNVTPVDLER